MDEYHGLIDDLSGYGSEWDPWRSATRGETARLVWSLMELLDRR